jgi:hypothetical protein
MKDLKLSAFKLVETAVNAIFARSSAVKEAL